MLVRVEVGPLPCFCIVSIGAIVASVFVVSLNHVLFAKDMLFGIVVWCMFCFVEFVFVCFCVEVWLGHWSSVGCGKKLLLLVVLCTVWSVCFCLKCVWLFLFCIWLFGCG